MRILFLDQSGALGGAELFLLDLASFFGSNCTVVLLSDGAFRQALEARQVPVQVLTGKTLDVAKQDGVLQGFSSLSRLIPLIAQVAKMARSYDVIYANTQKALVVGAIASWIARRPLVYHLHDIVSAEHFSSLNRRIITTLANRAALVIANSEASKTALLAAGGRPKAIEVVYNGFDLKQYQLDADKCQQIRQTLGVDHRYVVGHFSRLSPWKGQHVLINALQYCPPEVVAVFVGDALFGETAYVEKLHQQVQQLGLSDRVKFLGFRTDVPQLMSACNLVAHTSTAPEPFGRVIVEGMLCGKPVIASAAGGAMEIIDPEATGWLSPPHDPLSLAKLITFCHDFQQQAAAVADQGRAAASERFALDTINRSIEALLTQLSSNHSHSISANSSSKR